MRIINTAIDGVLVFQLDTFVDERGSFMETFRDSWLRERGVKAAFVQDNHASSGKGVLRGLHYQLEKPQGKLVRVLSGEVFDVAVDLRKNSPTFGKSVGIYLSAENNCSYWVPPGFAHGYLVTSSHAEVVYKCTDYYAPGDEHCLLWNDPALDIQWPLEAEPLMSRKDQNGIPLSRADVFPA